MGKLTVHTTEKQLGGEGCSSRAEQQPCFFFREAETNMFPEGELTAKWNND